MGSLFKKTPPKADLTKADYRQAVDERTRAARDAQLGLLKQLELRTGGGGPSLVDAQMKADTNKNLAQILATSAAQRGSSPKTGVLAAGGAQGRDIATLAGQRRAQEIAAAQGLRAQTGQQQQAQDLAQVMEPGKLLAGAELQRYEADIARQKAVQDQQAFVRTMGLSALSQGLGGMVGMGGGSTGTASFGAGTSGGSGSSVGGGASRSISPYFGAEGGIVPGYAEGGENDSELDVVDAKLSPEEIVLPRSVTKAENAPAKAKSFVEALLEQDKNKEKKERTAPYEISPELDERLKKRVPSFKEILAAKEASLSLTSGAPAMRFAQPAFAEPMTENEAMRQQREHAIAQFLAAKKGGV